MVTKKKRGREAEGVFNKKKGKGREVAGQCGCARAVSPSPNSFFFSFGVRAARDLKHARPGPAQRTTVMKLIHPAAGLGRPGIAPPPRARPGTLRSPPSPRHGAPCIAAATRGADGQSLTTFRIPPPGAWDWDRGWHGPGCTSGLSFPAPLPRVASSSFYAPFFFPFLSLNLLPSPALCPHSPDTSDDLLECPTIRHKLAPRCVRQRVKVGRTLPDRGRPGHCTHYPSPPLPYPSISPSPFSLHNNFGGGFADDGDRVALTSMKFASPESAGATCAGATATIPSSAATSTATSRLLDNGADDVCVPLPPWAVRAGAREVIYFDPAQTTAAIVTCGGLCPGLNDVIQGLVIKLASYGVPAGNVLGVRGGLRGFYDRAAKPVPLTKAEVEGIQLQGGTILGTSRGGADIGAIVRRLAVDAVDMCFVVGGNGGNAAAAAIAAECEARNVTCAVVGVPKSIDNDVLLVDRCFGFETAVQEAQRALQAAKVEAASAYRGVGLVKLMGRQSGFLAMQAAMASGVVDVCLIPEVRFALEGRRGLAAYVDAVLARQGHAVLCVAEGAGQDLLAAAGKGGLGTDASGNPILGNVGTFLKGELKRLVPGPGGEPIDVKFIGEERRERGEERGCAHARAFFSLSPRSLSHPKNHPSSRCRPLLHDPVRPHLRLRPHLRQGPRPQRRPRRLRGVHRCDGRPRVWAPRPPPHPRRRARAQDCGSQGQGLEPVDVVHWPARLCGG